MERMRVSMLDFRLGDELLFETRVRNDSSAFDRVWPLVDVWGSTGPYSTAQRIAGLVGGRLSESVPMSMRNAARLARGHRRETLWTEFVGRVGAWSHGRMPDETRLVSAMRKDWRAAIAEHAKI